jgi:hypothetical protein
VSFGIPVRNGLGVGLLASTSLSTRRGSSTPPLPDPTLSLDFIANTYSAAGATYTFDQLIDFTRTTSGTFIGSNGLLQTTPASRNVLLWTQEFNDATWVKTNTTVTANSVVAPDGTTTADTLTATGANATTLQTYTAINAPYMYSVWLRRLTGTGNVQITVDGTTYATVAVTSTWTRFDTVLVGLIGSRTAGVRIVTSGDEVYVWGAQLEVIPDASLTLGSELISSGVTGLVGVAVPATYNTTTGAGSVDRVDISNQSFVQWSGLSGNFRANISHTSGVGVGIRSGAQTGNSYVTVTGNATRTGYLPADFNLITITSSSGAVTFTLNSFRQITGTVGMPTTYTRNAGGLFPPRFEYDPTTLQPRGLLIESSRTNFLLHSSDLTQAAWSRTNVAVSRTATGPDGVANSATTVTATAGNATVLQAVVAASTTYVSSCYIKRRTGTGTVEITQDNGVTWTAVTVTAGWTRVATPSATVLNPTVGLRIVTSGDAVDVAFFQNEFSSFAPSSVIPTGASQVSRGSDSALVTGTNFSSWYNQTEGSMLAIFSSFVSGPPASVYSASSGATLNQFAVIFTSGPSFSHRVAATTSQADIVVGTYAPNTIFKSAFGAKLDSVQAAVNGVLGTEDTLANMPTPTRLGIGLASNNINSLNGHIRSLTYYSTRLTNAELQALST